MRKQQLPPTKQPFLDKNGMITPIWVRWLQDLSVQADRRRRVPDEVHESDVALSTDDYGKLIRIDNGGRALDVTLPTANAQDIDCWLTIVRTGTGRLTINCDSLCRIEYSSLGGSIWCTETKRRAANVTLQLINATQWGIIGATGVWKVK